MPNPLDNESRRYVTGRVSPLSTLPVEPFPRFPGEIKTKNPDVQRAWEMLEREIDRWRKNLLTAIQQLQTSDIETEIARIDKALTDIQTTLAGATNSQSASTITIQQNVSAILEQLEDFLPLAGGTMEGQLILAGDPALELEAVTKQYVDALIAANNQYVHIQLTPDSTWTMTHGRAVKPGGVRLLLGANYQQAHAVDLYDDTPGITRAVLGYNETGIGILTFS